MRFILAQGTLQETKDYIVLLAKKDFNWSPLPFLGFLSSSVIWLLQNVSLTTYRPPLNHYYCHIVIFVITSLLLS